MIYYSSDLLTVNHTASSVTRSVNNITAESMQVYTPNARTHLEVINNTLDNIIVVDSSNVPLLAERPRVSHGRGIRNQIIIRKTWGSSFTPSNGPIGNFAGYLNTNYVNYMCRAADDRVGDDSTAALVIKGFAKNVESPIEVQRATCGCVELEWIIDTSDRTIRKAISENRSLYLEDLDLMLVFNVDKMDNIPDHPHFREVIIPKDGSGSIDLKIELVLPEVGTYFMPINGRVIKLQSLSPIGRKLGLSYTLGSGEFSDSDLNFSFVAFSDTVDIEQYGIYTTKLRAEQSKDYCAFAKLEQIRGEAVLLKLKQDHQREMAAKDEQIKTLEIDLKYYQVSKSHEAKERDQAHEEMLAKAKQTMQKKDIKAKRAEQRFKETEAKQKRYTDTGMNAQIKAASSTIVAVASAATAVAIAYARLNENVKP